MSISRHTSVVDMQANQEANTPSTTEGGNGSDKWLQGDLPRTVEVVDSRTQGPSELLYQEAELDKKLLVCLCIGLLKGNGSPLIDLDKPPWCKEEKRTVKPSNADLVKEVERRKRVTAEKYAGGEEDTLFRKKPANKTKFLTKEVQRMEILMMRAHDESQAVNDALKTGAWYGMVPYLRLLHCLTDLDNVRHAFLRRHESMDRPELDAQGTESAPPTSYDIIAEAWNDETFDPWTVPSQCAKPFNNPINLSYAVVANMTPADGKKIKNTLSQIRANLLRMIQNWEESGQGDCGYQRQYDDEEAQSASSTINEGFFGSLANWPQEALDSRENFLNGLPVWYLYFWEQADKFNFLSSCLQRLSDETSPSDGGMVISDPGLSARRSKKGRKNARDEDGSDNEVSNSELKGLLTEMIGSTKLVHEHNVNWLQ